MKTSLVRVIFYFFVLCFFSSCATIVGGKRYWAKVQVPEYPNAKIEYKGDNKGEGEASFLVERREANAFSVIIKQDGCDTETKNFTQRTFRGWAFVGTVVGWTGIVPGTFIPLPWGIAVDGMTGAWWKPDINEKGVSKVDYKHFVYKIDYTGCKDKK